MKNVHVIPTPKPSRLATSIPKNNLMLAKLFTIGSKWINQNIHITNDEEIKEGNCILLPNNEIIILPTGLSQVPLNNFIRGYSLSDCRKIILTTDKDLIKDGVQAIPDEFLEWFVKNPSCEEVEVEIDIVFKMDKFNQREFYNHYKIIIPKEEPKQDLEKEMFELEQELDIPSHLRWHNSKPKHPKILAENGSELFFDEEGNLIKEVSKQETLEEAIDRYYDCEIDNTNIEREHFEDDIKELMIYSANQWQQERSYSEEDIEEYAEYCTNHVLTTQIGNPYLSFIEWFEQFKKK